MTKKYSKRQVACRRCGTVAPPVIVKPHKWHLEFLLWFIGVLPILAIPAQWVAILILPAFFYTLWRRFMSHERCSNCDSRYVYPLDSLTGKRIIEANKAEAN